MTAAATVKGDKAGLAPFSLKDAPALEANSQWGVCRGGKERDAKQVKH
jgi:hypothetical protein